LSSTATDSIPGSAAALLVKALSEVWSPDRSASASSGLAASRRASAVASFVRCV
jgi:hypothetical protein